LWVSRSSARAKVRRKLWLGREVGRRKVGKGWMNFKKEEDEDANEGGRQTSKGWLPLPNEGTQQPRRSYRDLDCISKRCTCFHAKTNTKTSQRGSSSRGEKGRVSSLELTKSPGRICTPLPPSSSTHTQLSPEPPRPPPTPKGSSSPTRCKLSKRRRAFDRSRSRWVEEEEEEGRLLLKEDVWFGVL